MDIDINMLEHNGITLTENPASWEGCTSRICTEEAKWGAGGDPAKLTGRTGNLLGACVQTGDWED